MRTISIRWRLTLWYAATLGILLAVFCISLLVMTRQQLLARTDAALREELQELALEVRLAKTNTEFSEHLQARFYQHDIYDFVVSDSQGAVLFASSGLTPAQVKALLPSDVTDASQYTTQELGQTGSFRIARTLADGPRGQNVVQAVTPLKPLLEEMRTLQLLMAVLLPLGIAVALAGGHFLAVRALSPVEQIVRVAESITISGLDRRIEVANPHDELGHLATTLNTLIARLERAVDEIRRFTADASHELRTPLAVLRSEAESALRKQRTTEEYERTLTVVVDEATRLGCLADQLLSLSRQDAGISEFRQEPVRIDAVLLDVLDILRPLAESRGVQLAAIEIESCEIQGEDVRLSQALFNVVDNAIKYTAQGGTVDIRCDVVAGTAVIVVSDTGIGIPPEHLGRVFDRFYRVDASRHSLTGGAGLGLAIARTAVMAHQGEIALQSEVGIGTTVTIHLPGAIFHKEASGISEERPEPSKTAAAN